MANLKKMYVFFLRMYVDLEIDQGVGEGLKYIHEVPKMNTLVLIRLNGVSTNFLKNMYYFS